MARKTLLALVGTLALSQAFESHLKIRMHKDVL